MIDKKIDSLPFHEMPWDDFERLVWELVQATEHLSPCHRYGTPGQAQGGIDIAGRAADGRWHAFQVKQVAQFTEASVRRALDAFVHGPRPHGATRLIIVTSCKGTRTQVRDLAHRYQARHSDLTLGEIWDAEHLGRLLRSQPFIVARYFGDEAARRFCDNDALGEFFSAEGSCNVGIPLIAADPFSLEVHEAIAVDHATHDSPLPVYFRRPLDDELDTAVDQALAGQSVMKVLLGDSSTGKTRAAWEAIQRVPRDWRLWHPTSYDDLLGSIDSVAPRTVLWLNEINRYLLSGDPDRDEQVAVRLAGLLRSSRCTPVLVLGTTWHEHWSTMAMAPRNERAQTKALLARCWVRVPETFSEHEVSALMAESEQTDRRMLQAARLAESGHVIQYLAGGPAQLERYETGSPAARAVLQAAMDARRLGHGLDLPHAFLKAAAASYLTSLQRDLAQPNWFRQAVEHLSAPCRGVRGPLAPAPGFSLTNMQESSHYRLSDFVELYARRHRQLVCPGEEFWSAAAQYSAGASDRVALSRAALDRGRATDAETLALAAAEEGEGAALYTLARWIGEHGGDDEDPLPYYELAAELGNAEAQVAVAWRYECEEGLDEAELWYRKAAKSNGRVDAVVGLASVLSRRGEDMAAAELNDAALKSGFFGARAVEYQARLLADGDQHERALLLTTQSFKAGNTEAFTGLAWTYRYKDTPRAIDVFLHAIDAGDTNAPRELAWVYEEEGETALADHFCEVAVSLGETNVLRGLGMIRRSQGDYRSAAGLFWRAYNLGLRYALPELARLREEEGNLKRAERLYWRVLEEGDPSAARDLVRILESSGRTRQAEDLAASFTDLLEALAQARAARGERRAAEHILAAAIGQGHPNLLLSLAGLRQQHGDIAGAERALRQAQDAGVYFARERLAKLLERASA
ncbi:restriction endonuclease [Streptomyces mirabilis]|uniref:restriction endonuclease n=1 Tax=Streptomyces mirabilis TaxID=68239 RepID=UPI0036A1042F